MTVNITEIAPFASISRNSLDGRTWFRGWFHVHAHKCICTNSYDHVVDARAELDHMIAVARAISPVDYLEVPVTYEFKPE